MQAFACDALDAAAPLAKHLLDVAYEWTKPKPRKGAQIAPAAARKAICDFDGSPCGLFTDHMALLSKLAAMHSTTRHVTIAIDLCSSYPSLLFALGCSATKGGGIWEPRAFFDACDDFGILLYTDMQFTWNYILGSQQES